MTPALEGLGSVGLGATPSLASIGGLGSESEVARSQESEESSSE
jgi:hypothetical protein